MTLARYPELTTILAIIILAAVFGAINPAFLSVGNLQAMLRASAYIGIPTIGMALALCSGMIDISIGALIGLVSCAVAWLIIYGHVNPILACGVGLLIGLCSSSCVAFAILRFKMSPFIATIAMSFVLNGLAFAISGGSSEYPLPGNLAAIGNLAPLGISIAFVVMLAAGIIASYFLHCTVWGLTVRATGSDREVARCTEVNPDAVNYVCFVVLGVLSALTGVLITLMINGGSPYVGVGTEFKAILACAIGGVSLFGYEGSVAGALLGVFLTQVISNGLIAAGMPPPFQNVVLGVLLIGLVALDVGRKNIRLPIREKE